MLCTVTIETPKAGPRGSDRSRDGVRDLEELEVEEDLLALGDEALDERRARSGEEFEADLVEAACVAQPVDDVLGGRTAVAVQGDDDLLVRLHGRIVPGAAHR